MRHSRGSRRKCRFKLKGGRFSIAEALQSFKVGQSVVVNINSSIHTGMPHPRYQGNVGTVVGKRGRAFVLEVSDQGKSKQILSKPEHLSVLKGEK